MAALDRLLLQRFGGKVGWGPAAECLRIMNFPIVWNFALR
jgi:hypothetical protein